MGVIQKGLGLVCLGMFGIAWAHGSHQHEHHHADSSTVIVHKESASDVTAKQCWIRFNPTGASALYVEFFNHDSQHAAYIVAVSAHKFKRAALHESYQKNGATGMRHVPEVEVLAQSSLAFAPSKYHAMMFEPHHVNIGDKVLATFTLSNGHTLNTRCTIKPLSAEAYRN